MIQHGIFTPLIAFLLCLPCSIQAQNETGGSGSSLQRIVREIVKNNTQLKAFRQQANAQVLSNSAELRLPDPDVDIAYLFNTPNTANNRTNVSISQSLDWDVLTGRRKALANITNTAVEKNYLLQTAQVMNEADEALIDVIYYNILCKELSQREAVSTDLLRLYTKKYDEGGATSIELNKLRLNVSVCKAALNRARSGRSKALGVLQVLNGGQPLVVNDTTYFFDNEKLPPLSKMLSECANNSTITLAKANASVSQQAVSVAKLQKYPTLKVGFQGEYNKEEKYSGVSLGFSIPLWGNSRKRFKQTLVKAKADQAEVLSTEEKFSTMVKLTYQQAEELLLTSQNLQTELMETDSGTLLRKALDEGQMSLIDFLLEQSFYNEARSSLIDAQHEAQLSMAKLRGLLR